MISFLCSKTHVPVLINSCAILSQKVLVICNKRAVLLLLLSLQPSYTLFHAVPVKVDRLVGSPPPIIVQFKHILFLRIHFERRVHTEHTNPPSFTTFSNTTHCEWLSTLNDTDTLRSARSRIGEGPTGFLRNCFSNYRGAHTLVFTRILYCSNKYLLSAPHHLHFFHNNLTVTCTFYAVLH